MLSISDEAVRMQQTCHTFTLWSLWRRTNSGPLKWQKRPFPGSNVILPEFNIHTNCFKHLSWITPQAYLSTSPSKKVLEDWSPIHCPRQFSMLCSINSVSGEQKKNICQIGREWLPAGLIMCHEAECCRRKISLYSSVSSFNNSCRLHILMPNVSVCLI